MNHLQEGWEYLGVLQPPKHPAALVEQWEAEIFGDRDGDGKRHWLPGLYLLSGDSKGARQAFYRQEASQQDASMLSPAEYLIPCLLAHIREYGAITFNAEAGFIMRRLYSSNPYALAKILGLKIRTKTYWHRTNTMKPDYVVYIPTWIYSLWTKEDKAILKTAYSSIEFKSFMKTDDALWTKATGISPGEDYRERGRLMDLVDDYRAVMHGTRPPCGDECDFD